MFIHTLPRLGLFFILLVNTLGFASLAKADVVKPALIEISANTQGQINIEIRASIEALLTGINSQYKDTQDAPKAEEYDRLRNLPAIQLREVFTQFESQFLQAIYLRDDQKNTLNLSIADVSIPEVGYPKVPRISLIKLSGQIDLQAKSVQWYYPMRFGDNAVRLRQVDEANEKWHWSTWHWLRDDSPSSPFSLTELVTQAAIYEVIADYIVLGFEHIVPKGLDHILFILGIFLLSYHLKPLLWQVSLFTLAHTITLGLSMNGVIQLPAYIVEPLIALSIVYVGIENIFAQSLHKSRLFLIFFFGLLHGLGFAGVLSDFGMPNYAFATALISFNIGVELAQIAIILLAFFSLTFWFRHKTWYRHYIVIPSSALIALIALYWTAERLLWI
jgi:hypothetical protein